MKSLRTPHGLGLLPLVLVAACSSDGKLPFSDGTLFQTGGGSAYPAGTTFNGSGGYNPGEPATDYAIQLTEGATPAEGILMVYYQGEWRGVCDDGWSGADTLVVCRELFGQDNYGDFMTAAGPSDNFWLDDVSCSGTESSIVDCPHSGWGNENCTSGEHVWILCVP